MDKHKDYVISTYKRFEMWLNGICPNCKERKLKIIKPKRPISFIDAKTIHFQCLNCDSKYYYPQFWGFLFMFCTLFFGRLFVDFFDFTSFVHDIISYCIACFFIFLILVPKLPKKPYITDKEKVVK